MFRKLCVAGLLLGLMACKEDDKNDTPAPEGMKDPQEQVFAEGVDPAKPLFLVFGDSLSTGVLSNTELGKNPPSSLYTQIGTYLSEANFNAVGFQTNLEHTDLAASTTVQPYGVRAALAAQQSVQPADIGVMSFAKFGAKAVDLPEMLSRWVVEEQNTAKKKPENILIMVGGNDFCSDMTVEQINQTYLEQSRAIHENSPDARIIIAPAPPVNQLAAIDFTYGPALTQISGEELSCKKFRETLCPRAYEEAGAVKTRIDGINSGIRAAFDQLKADGANAIFVEGMLNWQIKPEELAVDCFHPSQAGQTTIGGFIKQAIDAAQ